MNLLKSEFRKLVYTRSFYGYVSGAIFLSLLSSIPAAFSVNALKAQLSGSSLMDPQMVDGIYGKATGGYLFALVLGIAIMGNEFQNGQVISTFLASPKRIKVLYAKIIIAAGAGILMMLVSTILGLVGAYLGLSHYPHAKPNSSTFFDLIIAAVVSGAVLAIMGVAIGALIRNVRIAMAGAVIWLQVVEKLIVLFWVAGGKYLPSGLIVGMLNVRLNVKSAKKFFNIVTGDYFGPGISILLLLLYALIFAGVGSWVSLRRDID